MRSDPWTMHEFGLLLELSRQDWTPAAECDAGSLAVLQFHGLTRVLFIQGGIEAITLTELGWAEVARIQEKFRESSPMIDRQVQLMEFVRLGIDMRRAQRRYFSAAHGTPEKMQALKDSKEAERVFDRAASKIMAPSLDLGGDHVGPG